jgi:hypothetical protein
MHIAESTRCAPSRISGVLAIEADTDYSPVLLNLLRPA